MAEISGNRLAELTGRSWRTVKRRLEAAGIESRRKGAADLYDSAAALEAIYAPDVTEDGELDAVAERARRDAESADRLALQNAETRGDLARVSVMERELSALFADHRSNALALPSKLAPQLVGLNADQIRERIEASVYDLLTQLANYQPGK